ncbi:arNOG04375 family protein (homolog to PilT-type ATPase) [Natronomonas pharaonis DSM 2160]|uniref:ArNOG04375 family protein (Homolog to PilT-type ATPase) n=1 Tax=Natronomonas pharaonis (strain ATCC 35678 / DSM 2160 / CIP 103997 / JCM 8858 / NBRC 14720 / NCIMB 2260 / Gabara) TaxID=348780 RepID=A0A1U7ETG0_NATPD|nr:PINc/VapC family ATPase [Natronomonas pharaonis]CAI48190.1 arNOG04375 family protein (homolog to PilT-type ATPase) [Natronomonas pharaonis DSM 2160]
MDILPDTSAVIDGRVSERVEEDGVDVVYIPEAVVGELEAQANDGRDSGWDGLEELQQLAALADAGDIDIEYVGRRPDAIEKRDAGEGEIDALIRDLAAEHGATLLTSDVVQSEVAEAKGLPVEYVEPRTEDAGELAVEAYFDEETMSVHLKTDVPPMAKRGTVGEMRYEHIAEEPLSESEMRSFANDVIDTARTVSDGFVELSQPGMTIVQIRDMRIAVAEPPFADGIEVTAVRPIVKTDLDDYESADALRDRFTEHQRGVLISGAPGAGKSTFAQAVAEFLDDSGFAVKTMEKPRDLQVGPEITQYTELGGSMENTADSLLMVRPDYTIYDEVRKTSDFETFADMRMAGVGMIGVVHATRAIDALQRLVGRVELGMIPQVVDTVVYIEAGDVDTVYDVKTEVKVPHGLVEEDLARPVIVIEDFETGVPAYEIYTFNRQVVTVPLEGAEDESGGETGVERVAKQEIEREIRSVSHGHVDVEIKGGNTAVVWVEDDDISHVIGKGGGRISQIEDRLGIDIDVRSFSDRSDGRSGSGSSASGSGVAGGETVVPEVTSRHVVIPLDDHHGETVEVRADDEYLFTATVSRGGEIQVSRGSAIAEELEQAIDRGRQIAVVPQ